MLQSNVASPWAERVLGVVVIGALHAILCGGHKLFCGAGRARSTENCLTRQVPAYGCDDGGDYGVSGHSRLLSARRMSFKPGPVRAGDNFGSAENGSTQTDSHKGRGSEVPFSECGDVLNKHEFDQNSPLAVRKVYSLAVKV